MSQSFYHDVLEGLSSTPKFLQSKYFYNQEGDRLFQEIMKMPEYYLTDSEYEILSSQKATMLEIFRGVDAPFNLIEFGAGDGYKTKLLLEYFVNREVKFKYLPIDISENALNQLQNSLKRDLPKLAVEGLNGEYFSTLEALENGGDEYSNIILFLGSNIGNFASTEAVDFLKKLRNNMSDKDLLMIGFDLKKSPGIILGAYGDKRGLTKSFNLNLLDRINTELGGNFRIDKFDHFPSYNPESGETKSFLISLESQEVFIESLGRSFHFEPWETIHTEISRKFDRQSIERLARDSGFEVGHWLYDGKGYFADVVFKLKH